MSTMPRLIRVSCNDNPTNRILLRKMGYSLTLWTKSRTEYIHLNIWTLEASSQSRQFGLLLTKEDLEVIALLPTIDAVENYIYMLQDEALAKFGAALKEC